ncbi:MAG: C39 family peptidase [Candidatus Paceibacterota bacterium]|jgi:predicted double-glycine peptidase
MKTIKVPFYSQNSNTSCGPASLRMVLEYYGIKKSELELKEISKQGKDGTKHGGIIHVIVKSGLYAFVDNDTSIISIKDQINNGHPVIINFIEPSNEEGHYAVVIGIDEDNIILNDPWNGEGFTLEIDKFEKRWRSSDGKNKQWMVAISDTAFDTGRQYLPL